MILMIVNYVIILFHIAIVDVLIVMNEMIVNVRYLMQQQVDKTFLKKRIVFQTSLKNSIGLVFILM